MKTLLSAFICLQVVFNLSAQDKADLTVLITGLNSDNGQVFVALFDGPDDFPGAGDSALSSLSLAASKDTIRVSFPDLLPGIYAVSFTHDENGNDEMDTNMGIPVEKYGVSNNVLMGYGPPTFDQAKFRINNDTIIYIRPSN
jgi:uncharacterized protein (DUF2141 family)